jgi:multidrug resistance protein MdtO
VPTLATWTRRIWQDLQPAPGRLNSSLRIVLASLITLICLLVWQMPFASLGLYFVFLVGRDSPAVSVRSGMISILTLSFAVATELAVVILTDNDPMARVLSVSVVTFLAGVLMLSTTLTTVASTWGFIYCTLIALWENRQPADALVKTSLWLVATGGVAVVSSVVVEYLFASRHPAADLQQQRVIRYRALHAMFSQFASGAKGDVLRDVVIPVSRLAAAGQEAMQRLYNTIVERNLDTGNLPVGARVRITMLAQLMDLAAAFGSNNLAGVDQPNQQRCRRIAELCEEFSREIIPAAKEAPLPLAEMANPSLLDRVEIALHAIVSMPDNKAERRHKELVALPSSEVPIFIRGAYKDPATVAFALKLSLCATLCYIFYHAVDWPGIGTSVSTVLIAGLSTSGAIKQRLIFRIVGAIIGGLILGLGATAFLFPEMDSITSLSLLIAAVAFLSAWWATGRQFSYIGLQIAFSFYLVAFEGFSAPTKLAPARDRLIGILIALVVMEIVFDLVWPVRTVTAMRRSLASVLRGDAELFRLLNTAAEHSEILDAADGLRDRAGKTVATLRGLNDVLAYEFGTGRGEQILAGQTMLRAAFSAISIFWNQLSVLHDKQDQDFMTDTGLTTMRRELAKQMEAMADAVVHGAHFETYNLESLVDECLRSNPRFEDYLRNTVKQVGELEAVVCTLVGKPRPATGAPQPLATDPLG